MLLIPGLGLPAAPITPNAADIVAKSVAVTQQDWKKAPNYSFIDREVKGKHGHGQPPKTYEVLMIDGSPYNKLIAVDDVPLTAQQQAEEEQKLKREIIKRQQESPSARERRVAQYARERTQDHQMLTEMVNAFDYTLTGEQTVGGRKTWVLKATPKPGYVPHNREGKMLQRMQGTMWVDEVTYQWVRVQADVVKPVLLYGFFAEVKPGTQFELEQAPVSAGLWLPKQFNVAVNATAFGIRNESSQEQDTYSAYKPMSSSLSQLSARK